MSFFLEKLKGLEKIDIYPLNNYRLKLHFFYKNTNKYNDSFSDLYLIEKLNMFLDYLQKYNVTDFYINLQKSNYTDQYSITIIYEKNKNIDKNIWYEIYNNYKDINLTVFCINYENMERIYLTEKKSIINKYYNFNWNSNPNSFIQVNKNAELWIHDCVRRYYNCNEWFYGLGGQMGIYSKFLTSNNNEKDNNNGKDNTNNITNNNTNNKYINLTDCEYIYEDCLDNGQTNIFLVSYDKVELKSYFKNKDSTLVINISKTGLKHLAKSVLDLECKQIIYIGCCEKYIARDLEILCNKYKIENMEKIDQFPNTKSFSYVINLLL